jgi:hypothetical protein
MAHSGMGATKVKGVIKSGAGEITPVGGDEFFAVANGKTPGIYPCGNPPVVL